MHKIPIIATRIPDEIQQEINSGHGGHAMLGSSGVDPTVYENATGTAEHIKYFLTLRTKGDVEPGEVAAKASRECSVSETDIRLVMNAFLSVILDTLEEYGSAKFFTPFGILETMVKGSLENVTDQLDPEVNYLYLNCTPSDAFKRSAAALVLFNASEKEAPFKADKVVKYGTGEEGPFQCGTNVSITGVGFRAGGATVTFVDTVTKSETVATVVENTQGNVIVATVPVTLNAEHKHRVIVTQTIEGTVYDIATNKDIELLPPPLPDHQIIKLKQGERADNTLAFDDNDRVVVTVATNNGASYALRETKPVKIEIDYMDGSSRRHGILDNVAQVSSTATEVTFINRENDSDVADGDWWDHEVELTLYYADGKEAKTSLTFVRD